MNVIVSFIPANVLDVQITLFRLRATAGSHIKPAYFVCCCCLKLTYGSIMDVIVSFIPANVTVHYSDEFWPPFLFPIPI